MAHRRSTRRFEGFIHQKIDPHLQSALTLLSRHWGVEEKDVPARAIQETATREALLQETEKLAKGASKKKASAARDQADLKKENESLREQLDLLQEKLRAAESERAELRRKISKIRGLAEL